jgi:imidazole glycerol-phosphate synthase subunit HisF
MLRPRIIPCLLVQNGGLVKTVGFSQPKYVGDPINTVRIFNEKEVDELIVADIDATVQTREPNYAMIANLAAECRMPLCYAGGVKTPEQVERIISLGVEKVAISSAAIKTPELIAESAKRVGSQSIVVVLDVKKAGLLQRYELFTHNGKRPTGLNPCEFAKQAERLGAGEILVNAIDRDGQMNGYDLDLIEQVRNVVNLPLSVLGGAGSLADLERLIGRHGIIGAVAGSIFVFKGKYRAVLINYPNRSEKEALCASGMKCSESH